MLEQYLNEYTIQNRKGAKIQNLYPSCKFHCGSFLENGFNGFSLYEQDMSGIIIILEL